MDDALLYIVFFLVAALFIYGSPFVAIWNLGAGVMFLVVGVGTLGALILGSK